MVRGFIAGFIAGVAVMTIAGSSATALPPFDPSVTVDATTTIGSGGTNDWWGRAYTVRRPSDDAGVLIYRRGTSHTSAASELHIRFRPVGGSWTAEDTKIGGGAVTGFPMVPSTGNINAGEGMILVVPPNASHAGRLLALLWRVDGGNWPADPKGMEWAHSDDGGHTWTAPVAMTITGISDFEHTFLTDDWFADADGNLYIGGRIYNADNPTDSYVALFKSTDGGDSWAKVANITAPGSDTQEVGLTWLGGGDMVAIVGSLNNDETLLGISADMGATWSTSDVTGTALGVSRRHRVYTVARLMGEPGWWLDNRILIEGFENQNPGSSQDRRNAVWAALWNRSAKTLHVDGPHYLDSSSEDAGYGDIYYADAPGQFSVVSYQGSLAAASLKQYDLTIDLR